MNPPISTAQPISVLYAEDSADDFELTRLSFERARLAITLDRVVDGEECLAYLRKQQKYAAKPRPDLLLLDINMPRKNGFEVLKEISADPELCSLPVVVLTTSNSDSDVLGMYKLRCSSYIVKPVNFDKFSAVIKQLTNYWFTIVALPPTQ